MDKQSGRFTEGQTDKQTECVLLSVHREITWLCVGKNRGGVCICLFVLVCLWICVSCIWLCFLCVLTHVWLYVPCRYHTAGAKLSKPNSDSLHWALCDILPFIFPLWLKSRSLLSLAQLSPLEVSLAKKKNEAQYVWILSGDTLKYKIAVHQLFSFLNRLCIMRWRDVTRFWNHPPKCVRPSFEMQHRGQTKFLLWQAWITLQLHVFVCV